MAENIKKEDLLDEAYWHGDRYTVQNPYPSGVEAVDVEDIEKMETIDIEEIKRMAFEEGYRAGIHAKTLYKIFS